MMERCDMVKEYLRVLDLQNRQFDFSFFSDLVTRHVATFAFSCVGCRLGDDLPLDFGSLFYRIVEKRRGGYCFENNGLLYGVLDELGLSPKLYLARVIHNQDIHPGLTHRITMIEHGGKKYVLEVGFGFLGPRIPVPMSGDEVRDGERIFRIAEGRSGEYHMQVVKDGEFYSLYRFELARYGQADCEVGHFYSHRHPDATFVNHLVVSLILKNETRYLIDRDYNVITKAGTRKEEVRTSEQLMGILVEKLGVKVTTEESCQLYKGLV